MHNDANCVHFNSIICDVCDEAGVYMLKLPINRERVMQLPLPLSVKMSPMTVRWSWSLSLSTAVLHIVLHRGIPCMLYS